MNNQTTAQANLESIDSMNTTSDKVPTSGAATQPSSSSDLTVLRWFARILGVLWGGFFLVMFIGGVLQSPHWGDILHVKLVDVSFLVAAVLYGVGLFVALKWERRGAFLSVGALVAFQFLAGLKTFLAHRGLVAALFGLPGGTFNFGFLLFWLPVALHLICMSDSATARKRAKV